MRCIVTGGAGFIGSHLVDRLLEDGHEVVVIDDLSSGGVRNIPEEVWFCCDDISCSMEDFKVFKGIDWVFHLAGKADIVPSIKRPKKYYDTNVTGTVNVLEACRQYGIKRFIYAASSSCYGDFQLSYPTFEEDPIDPQYPYALTKWLGEECVKHWGTLYKIPWISLRLFNVYGPRAKTTGTYGAVMGTFLKQKLEGKPFTVVGDGEQRRDFIYVSDVVDAFVKAAESDGEGIYNIGSGNPQSINRLVELLGGDVVHIPERPGEPRVTHAGILDAKRYLKWEPKVSFEVGVKIMLDNIENWKDSPLWTPEKIEEETKEWFQNLSP